MPNTVSNDTTPIIPSSNGYKEYRGIKFYPNGTAYNRYNKKVGYLRKDNNVMISFRNPIEHKKLDYIIASLFLNDGVFDNPNDIVIQHKDGDKTNCSIDNLQIFKTNKYTDISDKIQTENDEVKLLKSIISKLQNENNNLIEELQTLRKRKNANSYKITDGNDTTIQTETVSKRKNAYDKEVYLIDRTKNDYEVYKVRDICDRFNMDVKTVNYRCKSHSKFGEFNKYILTDTLSDIWDLIQ